MDHYDFDRDGVVLSAIGANCGETWFAQGKWSAIKNTIVFWGKSGVADTKFLFYKTHNKKLWPIRGSAQPFISQGDAREMELFIPENPTDQKRIASILSAFDDKIELNNKISRTLEEMAQAIFKEWFVNFRFPGHEKVKMVDSELGEIPEGWEVKKLGEALKELASGSRPKGGVDVYKEGVPSIGAENIIGLGKYDYSKNKFVPRKFFHAMRKGIVQAHDVLIYKDGAEIGRKSFFMKGFPFAECCVNEHVFILRSNEKVSQIYLYFWLDRPLITETIKNLNANAAQPGINQEHLKRVIPIMIPEKEIVEKFTNLIMPSIEKIFNSALENQKLAALRDLLLPKLMGGEIRV
jgi:type I restriction enzyme S subunit